MSKIEVTRIWISIVILLSSMIPIAAISTAAFLKHKGVFEGYIGAIAAISCIFLLLLILWFRVSIIRLNALIQGVILLATIIFVVFSYISIMLTIS